jgi:predicted nucleic acid-binding protein
MRLEPARAREIVEDLAHWMPVDTTIGLVQQAWHWTDTAQLSYWDALILAAAQRAGAGYLLSEDFQPNRRDQDVVVLNPFDHSASEFGL